MKMKTAFTSGLRPGWDDNNKNLENSTHVQILAGGLDDSDAEAVNPFP
jgi:hypothetical protein